MTWAKLDDRLYDDPRCEAAGLEAMGLWTLALSYMGAYGTNGVVSKERIRRFAGRSGHWLAERLVKVGWWAKCEGGYVLVNWELYLIPNVGANLGRKSGESLGKVERTSSESTPEGTPEPPPVQGEVRETDGPRACRGETPRAGAPPDPDPSRPDPEREEGEELPPGAQGKTAEAKKRKKSREVEPETEIPPDWKPDPASYPLGASLGFDRERVDLEAGMFRDRALSRGLRFVRWHAAFHGALRMARKFEAEKGIPLRPLPPEPEPRQCPPRSAAMEAAIKRLEEERLSPEERTKRMNEALERVGRAPRGQLSVPFAAGVE